MSRSANNLPVINVGTELRERLDAEVQWRRANRDPMSSLSGLVRELLIEGMGRLAAQHGPAERADEGAPLLRRTGTE